MKKIFKKALTNIQIVALMVALMTGVILGDVVNTNAATENPSFFQKIMVTSPNGEITTTMGTPDFEVQSSYCYPGEQVELGLYGMYYKYQEDITYLDLSKYSYKWSRVEDGDKYTDLEVSEPSYTIDSVSKTDFYTEGEHEVYYIVEIYEKGEYRDSLRFKLYDASEYVDCISLFSHVWIGNNITLTPVIRDYKGKPVDVSNGDYTFKWYKVIGEKNINTEDYEKINLESSELNYVINNISIEDLSDSNGKQVCYMIEIYKNGKYKTRGTFQLFDASESLYINDKNYYLSEGDSVTLTPEIYYGDRKTLINTSNGEFTFKWYKVSSRPVETIDLKASGVNYTINNLKDTDLNEMKSANVYYKVCIYKNGVYKGEAKFYIYNNGKNNIAPTVVKRPAKAKITKIPAKKKTAKKIKISLKKISGAKGYKVAVYTTKKNAKNNKKAIITKITKKTKVTITSKKLKNKKNLYIKARAYVLNGKTRVYGKWSSYKKVKIK